MSNEPEQFATTTKPHFKQWSRNCAIGLYILSALWGVVQVPFPAHDGLYLFSSLCFALLATFWARFDAKARGITFLPILQMLYFLLWPIGGTIYLMYRSGWRGLLTAGLHGFGMMVLMLVTYNATAVGLQVVGLLS